MTDDQDKQGEGQYLLSIKQRAAVINARLVKAEKTAVKKRNRQQHGENCKGQGANCLFPFVRPRIFVKVGLGVDIPAICRQAEHDKIAKIHRLHNRRGQAPIAAQSHVPKEVKNVCRPPRKAPNLQRPARFGTCKKPEAIIFTAMTSIKTTQRIFISE